MFIEKIRNALSGAKEQAVELSYAEEAQGGADTIEYVAVLLIVVAIVTVLLLMKDTIVGFAEDAKTEIEKWSLT